MPPLTRAIPNSRPGILSTAAFRSYLLSNLRIATNLPALVQSFVAESHPGTRAFPFGTTLRPLAKNSARTLPSDGFSKGLSMRMRLPVRRDRRHK